MKKFVVTGASTYGVKNMGDDAMLATMVQGLKKLEPDCEITFLCRHPDEAYDKAFGFTSLKNLDHDTKEAASGRVFWGMNSGDPTDHLQAICEAVKEADLLIIGGNSFMEIFPNSFLKGVSSYGATLMTLAKFLGTPVSLFGLNVVDDIKLDVTRAHAAFMVGNSSVVTMREESGHNYLKDIGVDGEHIHVLGDPAYGMEPQACTRKPEQILADDDIKLSGRPIVGIGLRHEYWMGDDQEFEAFNRSIAQSLDQLVGDLGVDLLFIPNCTYTLANKWQDDRLTHRQIISHMKQSDRVYAVEQDLTVFETFSLFKLLDMHVSNRRHSCIFAAMNNVAFLALGGVLKGHMPPFLEELGVGGQITSVQQHNVFMEKVTETWKQREELASVMVPNVEALRKEAQRHIPTILGSM